MNKEEFYRLAKAPKRSKYNNRKTFYNGVEYDSKREADCAAELDRLGSAHDPKERVVNVRRQVPFPIIVNGKKICKYLADFVVTYGDGREVVKDAKGFKTAVYKIKKKLVEAQYDVIIEEI